MYADVLDILAEQETMLEKYLKLNQAASIMGLQVKEKKYKIYDDQIEMNSK